MPRPDKHPPRRNRKQQRSCKDCCPLDSPQGHGLKNQDLLASGVPIGQNSSDQARFEPKFSIAMLRRFWSNLNHHAHPFG